MGGLRRSVIGMNPGSPIDAPKHRAAIVLALFGGLLVGFVLWMTSHPGSSDLVVARGNLFERYETLLTPDHGAKTRYEIHSTGQSATRIWRLTTSMSWSDYRRWVHTRIPNATFYVDEGDRLQCAVDEPGDHLEIEIVPEAGSADLQIRIVGMPD